ncbi:MAG: MASE1 domain-containing protein, partial [Leptospiraceae bacterium]|nr:MASE1 domain-containing protein [Leptospiraceae bacterium]
MHSKIRFIITNILISIAFFLFAKIGLKIAFIQSNVTLIWLPSGLSLPVLLFGGYKYLPAISIGAFFTTYSTGAPIGFVIATVIGNSLEPLFSAYFLKSRLENNKYPLSLKNVGMFFLIAIIIAPTISALIGVLGLCLNGMVEWNFFYSISLGWWAGNAFGVLTLGAFVFAWLSNA